jgi:hypothetical protein
MSLLLLAQTFSPKARPVKLLGRLTGEFRAALLAPHN